LQLLFLKESIENKGSTIEKICPIMCYHAAFE